MDTLVSCCLFDLLLVWQLAGACKPWGSQILRKATGMRPQLGYRASTPLIPLRIPCASTWNQPEDIPPQRMRDKLKLISTASRRQLTEAAVTGGMRQLRFGRLCRTELNIETATHTGTYASGSPGALGAHDHLSTRPGSDWMLLPPDETPSGLGTSG